MKVFKFERNLHQEKRYLRLPFVDGGKWCGFSKDKQGNLVGQIELNGELKELKVNDSVQGLKLVQVDSNNEDIVTLSNGVEIPRLSFGTWLIKNEDSKEIVKNSINAGYIHIDTAQAYGNEEGVGIAIKNSLFKREDLFITSKVAAEIKSYGGAKKSIEDSLKRLGTDYIDLMLIHCPTPWDKYSLEGGYRYEKENLEVWRAMSEAYKEGKLRSIGVSNFNIDDLKNIMNNSDIKPMANQIPVHLGNVDHKLIDFCRENNIAVEAYCPLAHGRFFKDEAFFNDLHDAVSFKDLNGVQVMLSYASHFSEIIIPKASSMDHILNDMKYHVSLNEDDIKKMEKVYKEHLYKLNK